MEDSNRPPGQTICDDVGYTLNVQAYAETREITFRQECDPCDRKAEAKVTPEERAAKQKTGSRGESGDLDAIRPGTGGRRLRRHCTAGEELAAAGGATRRVNRACRRHSGIKEWNASAHGSEEQAANPS